MNQGASLEIPDMVKARSVGAHWTREVEADQQDTGLAASEEGILDQILESFQTRKIQTCSKHPFNHMGQASQ